MSNVRINIDETAIAGGIQQAWERGREMLSSQILRDCNFYCKEDTGMLIASSLTHSRLKEGLLIWQTPYAARQYYEIKTAYHDVNENATWRWVEVAKQNFYNDWKRQAQAIVRYYG
jgi:hypothetical protein